MYTKHCITQVICLDSLSDWFILLLSLVMASFTGTDNGNRLQMQMQNLESILHLLSGLLRLE